MILAVWIKKNESSVKNNITLVFENWLVHIYDFVYMTNSSFLISDYKLNCPIQSLLFLCENSIGWFMFKILFT